jgi:ribosome-binding protein aMBF1 (putative translation factor)
MMSSANLYAAILGLTLTFLISSGVALGQDGSASRSNPAHSGASGAVNPDKIDDATLKQTAKAYVKVRQIVQTAEQDLNKTTDNAQQQEIAKLAESRKMAAVKAEGLQPQQYNQVIQLARVDKAFEQKFLSYVNEMKISPR